MNDSFIRIERYAARCKRDWDHFISRSKNGNFLFYRDYMDYHSDRFKDHSLLFFSNEKMVAVLPANIHGNTLYSHAGLTFGGIISDNKMHAAQMIRLFENLIRYLKSQNISNLIYKAIPHIYHVIPAEEDLYVLTRYNARLMARTVSSTLNLSAKIPYSKGRKWSVKKSTGNNLAVKRSDDFTGFMDMASANLEQKYGLKPVHSADEMNMLAMRFPENIKLFAVDNGNTMLAGSIVYESSGVAHTQYLASSNEGKAVCALDFLIDHLINRYYQNKQFFNFGISTNQMGGEFNTGLANYKEEFGARTTVSDTYELIV